MERLDPGSRSFGGLLLHGWRLIAAVAIQAARFAFVVISAQLRERLDADRISRRRRRTDVEPLVAFAAGLWLGFFLPGQRQAYKENRPDRNRFRQQRAMHGCLTICEHRD